MQVITELYQALGHLMRATEGLATEPPVNKKAVKQSVTAERSVKQLLVMLGEKAAGEIHHKEKPCTP